MTTFLRFGRVFVRIVEFLKTQKRPILTGFCDVFAKVHEPLEPGQVLSRAPAFARAKRAAKAAGPKPRVTGNLCVRGDVAVGPGRTLFVNQVQPGDGACGGNAAGITIFSGNVGIQATNTLFVNTLRAFQPVAPTPQELMEFGISMPPLTITGASPGSPVILYSPLLFRSEQ